MTEPNRNNILYAVAAEREACAQIEASLEAKCERMATIGHPEEEVAAGPDFFYGYRQAIRDFSAAIRARIPC